jgi:hypothetical protein
MSFFLDRSILHRGSTYRLVVELLVTQHAMGGNKVRRHGERRRGCCVRSVYVIDYGYVRTNIRSAFESYYHPPLLAAESEGPSVQGKRDTGILATEI